MDRLQCLLVAVVMSTAQHMFPIMETGRAYFEVLEAVYY